MENSEREVQNLPLSPEILQFAQMMQHELNQNSHKGDWKTFNNPQSILLEFEWHKAKLLMALKDQDLVKIQEYCADCANHFLFFANSYKLIKR